MRLHEDKQLFRQAVAATANHFKIDPSIVEKDYYVTIFLEALSKRLPSLLFKGGTSLSKCYKIINRFSEDLDLTLVQDVITQGQRKQVKRAIKETCSELGLVLLNEAATKSRRDFNRYEIDYAPAESAIAIKPVLVVETTYIIKSYPTETKPASSLICDYMKEIQQEAFVVQYNLTTFPIAVQTLDRTLVDKIFALCDYYLANRVAGHSRHIYDIYQLLKVVPLDVNFAALFEMVRKDRRKSGNSQCLSAHEQHDIAELLTEILEKEVYKTDYKNITEKVLFDVVPYEEAICGIHTLIDEQTAKLCKIMA